MAVARTVSVKLQADVAGYASAMDKAGKSTKQVGDEAEGTGKRSKSGFGIAGAAAGGFAAVGAAALGSMVSASMGFDKAMSEVGAAANATGTELEAMRKAAIKAGADTSFSAKEAAQAEIELAKAGVSVRDVLGGGLQGALDLAAAGQLDVGKAAEIAATAMTQFKLEGSDIPHVADLLAAGAGKAQGSVEDIGNALKQSGLVASQFGLSIEDTTGTLAAFASAGLIGSDAGTSLKTMLLALANPAKETADLMETLGIHAYDTGGKFVGVTDLAEQLRTKLGGLTQAQRDQAMAQIFGSDAVRAANVLYQQGSAGISTWIKNTDDSGFAAEQAAAKMDNLAGDLDTLKGSIETALIQGGSSATGALRGLTKSATGAVNAFAAMPSAVQSTAMGLIAVGTAGAGALAAFGTIAPKIKEARTQLEGMGKSGEMASKSIGKIGKGLAIGGGVLAGLTAAGAAIKALQDASTAAIPGVETITKSLLGLNIAADLGTKLPAAGKDLEYLGAQIERLANPSLGDQVSKTFAAVFTAGNAEPQKLRDAKADINAIDQALAGLVTSGHPERAQLALAGIAEKAKLSASQVEQFKRVLPGYRDALAGVANSATLASGATGSMVDANGKVVSSTPGATSAIEEQGKAAKEAADKVDELQNALFRLTGLNLDVATTTIQFKNQLAALSETVKDNGASLDLNTQKGRNNRSALLELIGTAQSHAEAVGKQTGKVDDTRRAFEASIPQIVAQADKLGLNKAAVQGLIDTVVKLPPKRETAVSTPGAVTAKESVQQLHERLSKLPPEDRVDVTVNITGRDVTYSASGSTTTGGRGNRAGAYAHGGQIPGHAPHDRADNAWAKVTPGEWVIQKPTVDKLEARQPGIMAAINAGKVAIGGDPGVMRLSFGKPIRGQRPQAFADGGLVQRVQSHLRAQVGEPYIWGGVGPTGADCSGYAGQAYGLLTGRPAHRRYFTTASIGAAQGFKPGKGMFTVGVTAGSGHMAFQLGNERFEATPPRLRTGSSAASVNSFARQFYLPQIAGGFAGGDGNPGLTPDQIKRVVAFVRPDIIDNVFSQLNVRKFDVGGYLPPHSATLAVNGTRHYEPVGDPGARTPYRTQYRGGSARPGPTITISPGAVQVDLSGANGITESGVQRIVSGALAEFADDLDAMVGAGGLA